jgi:serine/alanine adding enzyme
MFGHFCVSLPFVNFGGALGTSPEAEHALMDEGVAWATREGARHIEFRDSRARTDDWPVRTDKVLMELTLPNSEEEFLKSIGAKLRSQAKRALREDAQVIHGGIELVDDFYSVFSQNMRDLGTPVYGKSLFTEILRTFPEQAGITLVKLGGEPAAAGFTMTFAGRREIPWASALRRYNRVSVNMLLYAEIIKQAIRDEQRVFDFGRSTIDAGTFRFKKQWGAVPQQLYWHYWLREGGNLPGLNPDNPKFALAIKIWQKLPIPITKLIGPSIVKYLP